MLLSVIILKIPKVRLLDQSRASISTHYTCIPLKFMAHILFQVKGVFAKVVKSTLCLNLVYPHLDTLTEIANTFVSFRVWYNYNGMTVV